MKKVDAYFAQKDLVPTQLGLAMYLDVNRDTLHQWLVENGPFSDIIKKAKDLIENFWQKRLALGQCTGAIFWLKCQAGWKDTQEVNVKHEGDINLSINIKGLDGANV